VSTIIRLCDYIAEKYVSLVKLILDNYDLISHMYSHVDSYINGLLDQDKLKHIFKKLKDLCERWNGYVGYIKIPMPILNVLPHIDTFRVAVVERGSVSLNVFKLLRMPPKKYSVDSISLVFPNKRLAEKTRMYVCTRTDGIVRCMRGVETIPELMLFSMMLHTTEYYYHNIEELFKEVGLWDFFKDLIDFKFRLKYPILNAAEELFGYDVYRTVSRKHLYRVLDRIDELIKGIHKEGVDMIELRYYIGEAVDLDLNLRHGYAKSSYIYELDYCFPCDLIKMIDATLFALTYYSILLKRLYEKISGKSE